MATTTIDKLAQLLSLTPDSDFIDETVVAYETRYLHCMDENEVIRCHK